jgi:8-oxo-dGTP diphosphatase
MHRDSGQQQPLEVCAAVIIEQGKVLISKRPPEKQQGGLWEFPGGKLDAGETPQQALMRELKEELGILIEVGEPLATVRHLYDWGEVLIMAYLCRHRSGKIEHLEVTDHAWVTPAELYDYDILAADRPFLERINERFA